jgi:hypothetical protein
MFQGKQLETVGETACPLCNVAFSQLVTYRQHVYQHMYPYVCQQCEERFRTDPVKVLHTCSETIYKCEMCMKQFSSLLSLSQHQVIHGVPQFHCYECGRSFHHCVSEFSCSVCHFTLKILWQRLEEITWTCTYIKMWPCVFWWIITHILEKPVVLMFMSEDSNICTVFFGR